MAITWPKNRRLIGTKRRTPRRPREGHRPAQVQLRHQPPRHAARPHPALPARPCPDQEHRHRRRREDARRSRRCTSSPRPASELYYAGDEIVGHRRRHRGTRRRRRPRHQGRVRSPRRSRQGRGRPQERPRRRCRRSAEEGHEQRPAGQARTRATTSTTAFKKADVVHEGEYGVPTICHQCLESHGLVAEWDKDGEPDRLGLDAGGVRHGRRSWPAALHDARRPRSSASRTTWAAASAASSAPTSRASSPPSWHARPRRRSS